MFRMPGCHPARFGRLYLDRGHGRRQDRSVPPGSIVSPRITPIQALTRAAGRPRTPVVAALTPKFAISYKTLLGHSAMLRLKFHMKSARCNQTTI